MHSMRTASFLSVVLGLLLALGGAAHAGRSKGWAGTVAKIGADGRVYITAGTSSGLRPGVQLIVRREGEPILDPKSHRVIGRELGRTVAVLALESHLGAELSVCAVERGGRGLKIGDPVSLDARDAASDEGDADDEPVAEPPRKKPAPPPAPKKEDAKARPAAPHPSETTPRNGRCPEGKFVNAATAGHCCWPEQIWSDHGKGCIGTPRCPPGFQRSGLECVPRAPSPSEESE